MNRTSYLTCTNRNLLGVAAVVGIRFVVTEMEHYDKSCIREYPIALLCKERAIIWILNKTGLFT